jgi:hypothetical protein
MAGTDGEVTSTQPCAGFGGLLPNPRGPAGGTRFEFKRCVLYLNSLDQYTAVMLQPDFRKHATAFAHKSRRPAGCIAHLHYGELHSFTLYGGHARTCERHSRTGTCLDARPRKFTLGKFMNKDGTTNSGSRLNHSSSLLVRASTST